MVRKLDFEKCSKAVHTRTMKAPQNAVGFFSYFHFSFGVVSVSEKRIVERTSFHFSEASVVRTYPAYLDLWMQEISPRLLLLAVSS